MLLDLILTMGGAFVLSGILNIILRPWSARRRILLSGNIPCVGGLSFGVSFLLSAFYFFFRHFQGGASWNGLALLGIAVLLFGTLDDLKNLSVRTKLVFQILVLVLLISLGVRTQIAALNNAQNIFITSLWLLWIFNAFNLLDVMDGLSAGVAVIVCFGFFAVARQGDFPLGCLVLILAGALGGFLIFNVPPAKIYMGNGGSYFLGFIFGVVSLLISYATGDHVVALATPGLILGFLIFDTFFLVAARIWRKKKPHHKSDDHLCLRYLSLGYSKKKILYLLLGLCLFFAASGAGISRAGNIWGLAILGAVFAVSARIARKAMSVKILD